MLATNTYQPAYIDACRSRIDEQVASYKALKLASAAKFERQLCHNLVLVLDRSFVHRTRGREGKDGNPLNEVRMLCDSILENDGVLAANKTIKYDAASSVTKLAVGSQITLTLADFVRLYKAFFTELETRFS